MTTTVRHCAAKPLRHRQSALGDEHARPREHAPRGTYSHLAAGITNREPATAPLMTLGRHLPVFLQAFFMVSVPAGGLLVPGL